MSSGGSSTNGDYVFASENQRLEKFSLAATSTLLLMVTSQLSAPAPMLDQS